MSLSLSTLRSRVGGAIGLSTITGSSELALIDGWLNEGCEQVLMETKCRVRTLDMNLTADEDDYELPVELLAFTRIWITPADGSDVVDLVPIGIDEMLDRRRYNVTGYTANAYTLQGADLLMINPAAVSSSDVLSALYVPAPTAMSSAADTPYSVGGIPGWLHPAVEEYAKWKAADWDDDTSSQVGLTYQKNYMGMVKDGRAKLNRMSGGWAPARHGGRRRRTIPTSPGVDTGN